MPPTKESGIPERPWYGPESRWKELRERMETAEAERDVLREALEEARRFLQRLVMKHGYGEGAKDDLREVYEAILVALQKDRPE